MQQPETGSKTRTVLIVLAVVAVLIVGGALHVVGVFPPG